MDRRLTLKQMRVLVTLLSFRSKSTNLVFPSREAISERCGMAPSAISTATSELEALGWVKKIGNGGRSRACKYEITVPDFYLQTVSDSVTVTEPVTVTDSITKTVTESVTKTVTDSVRGIEQTINKQVTDKVNKPESVQDEVWNDFLQIRKAAKAPLTNTALKAIESEAMKAGISLSSALEECCSRGWRSFKADWVAEKSQGATAYDRKMQTLASLTGGIHGSSADAEFKPITETKTIDMEGSNANLLR